MNASTVIGTAALEVVVVLEEVVVVLEDVVVLLEVVVVVVVVDVELGELPLKYAIRVERYVGRTSYGFGRFASVTYIHER